jgi:exopolyphosphatase/guanosine-5'-triphosphate,3'-diphosphate pyrophosphatase
MIAAALDLGSNTLRLLVAEVDSGGNWHALKRGLASPRLGRGLKPGGALSAEAKNAARQAATEFTATAREQGAKRIALAATQACRMATGGDDFVAELGRELGLDSARVISGAEEAALSRRGVLSRLTGGEAKAKGAWLADIGGGSTEIMDLGQADAPVLSLPLGAVTLTEAHIKNDPPGDAELASLNAAVKTGLKPALQGWRDKPCGRLVATAGTAATLAALRLGITVYAPEEINNLEVSKESLEREFNRLAALPLAGRQRELALEPARADIIISGLAILTGLVTGLGLNSFITMDAGLLEGILLEHAAIS